MEKSDIKANYNVFLRKYYHGYMLNINTREEKEQYNKILEELLDTSKESVQCLTKEETEIARKEIGVYGRRYNLTEIGKEFNKSNSSIASILNRTVEILRDRISRGCAHLKDAYANNEIDLSELLDTRLFDMDYTHNTRIIDILFTNGIKTIGDLVQKPISELKKIRNVSGKDLNDLVDYIHNIGLIFKGEAPVYESVVEFPKKISSSVATALDELDKEEEEINEIIEESQERQQKIYQARKELLKLMKDSLKEEYYTCKEQDEKQNIKKYY